MLGHAHLWEVCTFYRRTGVNANGQPTYGAAIQVDCWISRKTKTLRAQGGTDIQSSAQVTFPADIIPAAQDKVILPEGKTLVVQDVAIITGAYGKYSHSVAFL